MNPWLIAVAVFSSISVTLAMNVMLSHLIPNGWAALISFLLGAITWIVLNSDE